MTGAIKNREREGIWRRRNNGGFITWSYKENILVLRKLSKLKQPYVLQKEKPNHKISIKIKIFVFQQRKCKKVKIISNCPILRFSIVPLIDAIVWKNSWSMAQKLWNPILYDLPVFVCVVPVIPTKMCGSLRARKVEAEFSFLILFLLMASD